MTTLGLRGASSERTKLHRLFDRFISPKLSCSNHSAGASREPGAGHGAGFADLPPELLLAVLAHVDPNTLATLVPLVCKSWRDASADAIAWRAHLPPGLVGHLGNLASLGPRVTPARLFLALHGRNFLRNPEFRRENNSSLLPALPLTQWGQSWQRTAWVLNMSVGKEVAWERSPHGMSPPPPDGIVSAAAAAAAAGAPPSLHTPPPRSLPPPLPYPGGAAPRLTSLMQQALRGLYGLADRVAAAEEELGRQHEAGSVAQRAFVQDGQEQEQPCLAMLGSWSEVVQVVDLHWELQRRGLSAAQAAHLLDAGLALRLSVHVGSRWDSAGECAMALLLDEGPSGGGNGGGNGGGSGGDGGIPSLQSYVARPTRSLGYQEREHMQRGAWEEFQHSVPSCPRGVRRAVVMLRGRRAPVAVGGGGGGGGGSGGAGAGAQVEEGPAASLPPREVEPGTRFCGAKFASAELVFVWPGEA